MKIIKTIPEVNHWLGEQREANRTIGFVPTMGALHEGHLSLIRLSLSENDITVCSIFVNPIQFNNTRDLELYPRMPAMDAQLLSDQGCDMLFIPTPEEMYPKPIKKQYHFGLLDKVMEGAFRPGHFNGVAVVVHRLFEIVSPTIAYFGLKDYQQLCIIREMVNQEGHHIKIKGCPIIREKDGLAMSSRNLRLTDLQRRNAPAIYTVLKETKLTFRQYSVKDLKSQILTRLSKIPESRPEYVEIVDAASLQPIQKWEDTSRCILCIAVFLGDIRLIDNIMLIGHAD